MMSLVNIPLFIMYSNEKVVPGPFGGLTLGNLGQATVNCLNIKLVSKGVHLGCLDGTISNITSFGVFAGGSEAALNS